jgi:hypothetical protein
MFSGAMGQTLLIVGLVIAGIGLFMMFSPNIPFLGKLPGDISWQHGNTRIFAPLATSIVLSIVLTIIVNLVLSMRR